LKINSFHSAHENHKGVLSYFVSRKILSRNFDYLYIASFYLMTQNYEHLNLNTLKEQLHS